MEGRFPKALVFEAFTLESADALRCYVDERIPQVLTAGWATQAAVHEVVSPAASPAHYLTVFETDRWDVEDLVGDRADGWTGAWRAATPHDPDIGIEPVRALRRCGPSRPVERSGFVAPSGAVGVSALVVVWSRVASADARDEKRYHRWYNDEVVPARVRAGEAEAGYRYACAFREPSGERLFAALYECATAEPAALAGRFAVERSAFIPDPPVSVEFLGTSVCRPVDA